MDWLDTLWLGIVHGLVEYLPISSSGHLEICRPLLGVPLAGAAAFEFLVFLAMGFAIMWPAVKRKSNN